jgi:hypothetical protein
MKQLFIAVMLVISLFSCKKTAVTSADPDSSGTTWKGHIYAPDSTKSGTLQLTIVSDSILTGTIVTNVFGTTTQSIIISGTYGSGLFDYNFSYADSSNAPLPVQFIGFIDGNDWSTGNTASGTYYDENTGLLGSWDVIKQ